MTRNANRKQLPCVGCQELQTCAAEAVRVICPLCVQAGVKFPTDEQESFHFVPPVVHPETVEAAAS
jgi:hypothetical protein